MNGQMKNFDVNDCIQKDKLAKDFIETVNPYRTRPSLGIDLRQLARYIKDSCKSMELLSEAEMLKFKI